MAKQKGSPKTGGRQKGTGNLFPRLLKDAILKAAENVGGGGKGGLVAFLEAQARKENNTAFMSLVGKVLPTQLATDGDDIGPPVIVLRKFSYDGPEVPLIPGDYSRRQG